MSCWTRGSTWLFAAVALFAQGDRGTITGTVTDPGIRGQRLRCASVLRHLAMGVVAYL
ncbi:MAG TPA: hypothetical protein VIY49_12930 [Bryobacteraceae bacterium]